MTTESHGYARVGLIGNPSDGYYGKTISCLIKNFSARVVCEESDRLQVVAGARDSVDFSSIAQLAADVELNGYYGGLRLLKGSLKHFHDYCRDNTIDLPDRNCRLSYDTNIPMRVGLAGSSAIIAATVRALMEFYGVEIPKPILPRLILEVETKELRIPAGYQDRVIQVYGGAVFMDFDKEYMEREGHGRFEELDPSLIPPLYVAYQDELSEGTEVFHSDIRSRWEHGDPDVVAAMRQFADFAEDAKGALLSREHHWLGKLMDENFDLRATLFPLSAKNHQLVRTARELGCSSKFAGSGGAVVGILPDDSVYPKLEEAYAQMGAQVIRPEIL